MSEQRVTIERVAALARQGETWALPDREVFDLAADLLAARRELEEAKAEIERLKEEVETAYHKNGNSLEAWLHEKAAREQAEREFAAAQKVIEAGNALLHEVAIAPVEHDAGGYLVVQMPTPIILQIRAYDAARESKP